MSVSRASFAQHLVSEPLALAPRTLTRILAAIEAGEAMPRETAARGRATATGAGAVGVVPIHGVISPRASFWDELFGGTSVEAIREVLRGALADSSIGAIVLDVDSPGGAVAGIPELAAEIRSARGVKPIVAVANSLAASAGYWLASQATEVVASPSATVGSVGVITVHQDFSGMLERVGIKTTIITAGDHKADANPYEPLSDDARADLQDRADAFHAAFIDDVAKGRRVPAATIKGEWGARVMLARQALEARMVDFIGTYDDALRRASRSATSGTGARAEGDGSAEGDEFAPFADRLVALATDAAAIRDHALARASIRAAEDRAALSETQIATVRDARAALDEVLALEPARDETPAVSPPAAAQPPASPPVAAFPALSPAESLDFWKGVNAR